MSKEKTISYCQECGSMNVEFKQWILPNKNNETSGGEYDRSDCWCADCEEHNHIESCLESEYPAILEQIKNGEKEEVGL